MASTRYQLAQALLARLAQITVDNGFNSDAGRRVFFGVVPMLGSGDPAEAIALFFDDERAERSQTMRVLSDLQIGIAVVAKISDAEPGLRVEELVEDVKRAIELEDRTLGGLLTTYLERAGTNVFERDMGGEQIGLVVTYRAPVAESWGAP